MNKLLRKLLQKKRIIDRIVEKYNLPKYHKNSGKTISYTLSLVHASKFDEYTGKKNINWCYIKLIGKVGGYLCFTFYVFDRHGRGTSNVKQLEKWWAS